MIKKINRRKFAGFEKTREATESKLIIIKRQIGFSQAECRIVDNSREKDK